MVTDNKETNLGLPWLMLTVTFAIHVIDEAANDFLAIYNPAVVKIRDSIPFLPIPNFSFGIWITGLIILILILFVLLPFAYRNAGWILKLSYLYGIVMLLNGIGHILGSIALRDFMPGVYSAPLLLITSLYFLRNTLKVKEIRKLN